MTYIDDLAMVKDSGWKLEYVKSQTPEICLAAVNQHGWALQYVKEQTPELCLAAVKKNGWALKFINEEIPDKINLSNSAHRPFYDLGWRDGDLSIISLAAVKKKWNGFGIR